MSNLNLLAMYYVVVAYIKAKCMSTQHKRKNQLRAVFPSNKYGMPNVIWR